MTKSQEINLYANDVARSIEHNPALRRAIMRANPDYFGMTGEEQEKYRADIPEDHEFIIEQQLFGDLLNVKISNEQDLREAHRQLFFEDLNIFNKALLPIRGVGDDFFWLNEYLADKTLLDYKTLYDYDLHDHKFQEQARKRKFPEHEIQPYRGSLYGTWSRLFIDRKFYYGVLYCAAGYVFAELDEYGGDVLKTLIPHEYCRGKNDGKSEKGGFVLDLKINAGGKEEQLDELNHRFRGYQKQRYRELQDMWDKDACGCAYLFDTSHTPDTEMTFVFSDKTALQSVRFRHFMADCRAIESEPLHLNAFIKAEKKRLEDYLSQQFEDIERNFDPKILRLRKKRKIILSPQAKDDMDHLI